MIQTVVSNASAPEYGQATISFPIREEDYPSVVNMLQRMGLGDPLERDCRVDEVCGNWPILKRLEKVAINLDEMDYLAKRLDSFDAQEKAKFQAAAVRFGLFDMRHLIDLTFCCQETTVITDFSDLEKVGRRHYLDVNGSSAPSEELENVDGYETALLLIGDGDGTITPYGVIYDNGMQLRPVYDGQNFPLYQHQDAALVLGLTHESDLDMNSATTWLFLPASAERLERALKRGGFEPGSSIHCTCVGGNIQEELEARLDFERESLKDLNTFASAIASIDEAQHAKFKAVIQMANPQSAAEMTALAQNLDLFDFVPGVHSPREYGEFMIRESGHFDLDDDLVPFIDYKAYGQKQIDAEGGVFNDQGYLKGGRDAAHLAHRMRYVATREGVELLTDQHGGFPATKKQQAYIRRLLRTFPEAEDLLEYDDYRDQPTRERANEFIRQVRESFVESLDQRENFLDYIAHRPGVQLSGEHGLWDARGKVHNLAAAVREVAEHPGNVWTPVIALRREDAERLSYDNAANWQALVNANICDIAHSFKIHPDHLRWYAAFHQKEKSVHIHMVVFSTDPQEGYLTKQGIRQLIGQPKNTSAAVTPHRRITSARTVFFCWRPRMETPRPCVTWAISTVRASCRTVIPTRKRRGSGMQRRWQSSGKRRRRCPAARQSIGSQGCMPTASVWRQTMRRRNTGSGWLPKRRIHSRRMPWPLCCSSRESRRRLRTGWGARQSKEIQRRSMPWADCICWGPASRMTGILPWSCWAGPPHRGTAAPKHWRRSRNGCPSCQRRWQSPGCSTT